MRLLQLRSDGGFELTDDLQENIPRYAALSHTWLTDDEEVTFSDLKRGTANQKKAGSHKIRFCGEQAAKDGLKYFWVDTCCIDKSSSAEVQEAICSMFLWYRNATKCYVYLADVKVPQDAVANQVPPYPWESQFRSCRWFTRGWTLQELIAPASVDFFSAEGTRFGDKRSLEHYIHEITGIPHQALRGDALARFSVAERLSWAENRQTKRKEDLAYSLLGIFAIFMPLIYGEGAEHAFARLREEIDKKGTDSAKLDHLLAKLPTAPQAAFNSLENQHGATCLPETRVELLQDIKSWADGKDERCIFWLNGIAGTGKSTVARTIAREYHDRGNLGASFFFSRGGGDVGLAERLFTTLASQLATKVPCARKHICEAIMEHQDIAGHSLRDQWDQLILNPLSKLDGITSPSTIVLVIDALDECDSERDIRILLRLLATTSSLNNIRLRIFITSRPEIPIRCGFSQIPEAERQVFVLHDIQPTIVDRDLSLFFEHSFILIREERGFAEDWPGTRIIKRLVEISCGLFIWASTACRFIREGKRLAERRIRILLNDHRTGAGPEKQLDEIYITVLKDSIQQGYNDEEKQELYDMLREVLGSIVTLFSPLSTDSLAQLLRRPPSHISETLADLHTIFHIPTQTNRPIRPHHPTFRDFLLDKQRCRDLDFWVNEKQAHEALGDNCVQLMSKMLKKNICGLPSPGTLVKDVDPNLIEQCIPPELQYAILYFAQHYRQSGTRLVDGDHVHRFMQEHFLHWLEAINLIGKGSQAAAIVRMYQSLLPSADNLRQVAYCKDARRFIFAFQSIVEQAPLQTYCTALAFIRPTNELKHHFWSQIQPWMKDIRIADAIAPKVKDEYNYVNDIAFTPDGKQVASGATNEVVRLWDVGTKAALGKLTGQTDKVSSVAISPDGVMIASGSDDASVMVWNLQTRAILYTLYGHSRWVNSVTFSPDGKLLASASMDETIRVWDAVKGQELKIFGGHSSCVNSIRFSPDSSLIVSGSVDQMVRIWDVAKGEIRLLLDGHSGCVNSVDFSPNGKQVISGSDDMTSRVWDAVTGTECMLPLRGHLKKVTAVTFSPNARLIASGSDDKSVRLWKASTGAPVITLTGHTSGINAVTFSPDGQILASGAFNDEVRLWDAVTGASRGPLDDFDLDDFEEIAKPSGDNTEGMDYASTLVAHEDLKGHASTVICVVFSPDGQLVATGSHDTTIKLWARDGTSRFKLEGHTGSINNLAFSPSPDSHLLASASMDKTVKLWNTATGKLLHTFEGHTDNARSVVFSPDGKLLASCSTDKTTRVWDASTGKALSVLEGHADTVNKVAFSPDNRLIASCSADTTIKLWDVVTETGIGTLKGHTDTINSVAFSQDGTLLISASADTTIRLWTTDGTPRGTIRGHTLPVNTAAFSPDNKLVVSCSDDETIRLWNSEIQEAPGTTKIGVPARSMSFSQEAQGILEVGVPVREVAFSLDGQYVETDRGRLDVKALAFPATPSSPSSPRLGRSSSSLNLEVACPHTLFVVREWVRRMSEDALWLPAEYHATTVATWDDTVVLGHALGAVSFVSF